MTKLYNSSFFVLFIAALLVLPRPALGGAPYRLKPAASSGFVPNVGQIHDAAGNPVADLLYSVQKGKTAILCYRNRIEIIQLRAVKQTDPHQNTYYQTVRTRTELVLTGASEAVNVLPQSARDYHQTWYGADGQERSTDKVFDCLLYENIYPNIDFRLNLKAEGLKYDFILRPGAKVSDIGLKVNGAALTRNTDGSLKYSVAGGHFTESAPVCFTAKGSPVKGQSVISGNTIRFQLSKFSPSETVIIDPYMRFSSYWGGEELDVIQKVIRTKTGLVYMVGNTMSASFIGSQGSYQDTISYQGIENYRDAFITCITESGELRWSTYYGGQADDGAYGAVADANGNIYVGGLTASSEGMATPGAYQTQNNGGGSANLDAFLVRFDTLGKRNWATWFGGSRVDGIFGLAYDPAGYIYATGFTKSSDYIATSSAFKKDFAGGGTSSTAPGGDIFLAKFTTAGQLKWSTYYGGAGDDLAYDVAIDAERNVLLTGNTISASSIATTGAYQTSRGGSTVNFDGFLLKFDSAGNSKWSTYYGGETDEYCYSVRAGRGTDIYIYGQTNSTTGIASPNAEDGTRNASDCFLAKFDKSGKRIWGTYVGGNGSETSDAMDIDEDLNLYLCGTTTSSDLTTSNAHRTSINGGFDGFVAIYDSSGSKSYASYIGGNFIDHPSSINVFGRDQFYVAGATNSDADLAVPTAWQPDYFGGSDNMQNWDGFVIRFDTIDYCYETPGAVITGAKSACQNSVTYYQASKVPQRTYNWTITGGTILGGGQSDSVIVQWGSGTQGTLKATFEDYTLCTGESDYTIQLMPSPAATFSLGGDLCRYDTLAIQSASTGASSFEWLIDNEIVSRTSGLSKPMNKAGIYKIKLRVKNTGGCTDSMERSLIVMPGAEREWTITKLSDTRFRFQSADTLHESCVWDFGDGKTADTNLVENTYNAKGTYKVKVTITHATGCTVTRDTVISVGGNGIQEIRKPVTVKIWPQPVRDQLTIELKTALPDQASIEIYDASGRRIRQYQTAAVNAGTGIYNIPAGVSGLQPGTYLLKITGATLIITPLPFIVVR